MGKIKKTATEVMTHSRDAAVRVGKIAKSAAVAGAKAGAVAAMAAGALEAERSWKETTPAAKKRTRKRVAAVLAGAVVLGAVGAAIVSSRKKK